MIIFVKELIIIDKLLNFEKKRSTWSGMPMTPNI